MVEKKKLEPITPKKFLAITGFKGFETLSVFDEKHQLLFEVEKSKYIINTVRKLIGE